MSLSLFKRRKKWYIKVNEQMLGPFTLEELKKRHDLSPFTLVRKKRRKKWQLMADVPELAVLFRHSADIKRLDRKDIPQEVLTLNRPRYVLFLWMALLLLIVIYLIIGIYATRF